MLVLVMVMVSAGELPRIPPTSERPVMLPVTVLPEIVRVVPPLVFQPISPPT